MVAFSIEERTYINNIVLKNYIQETINSISENMLQNVFNNMRTELKPAL